MLGDRLCSCGLLEGPGVRSGLDVSDGDEPLGNVELDLRVASEASRS